MFRTLFHSVSSRWVRRLFTPKIAWTVVVLHLLITAGALWQVQNISLDYDFEKFFPQDDPELDFYLQYREQFGSDNDFLLIALHTPHNNVVDTAFIRKTGRLEQQLTGIPRVKRVTSIRDYRIPVKSMLGMQGIPLVSAQKFLPGQVKKEPLVYKNLISRDLTTLSLIVEHQNGLSKKASDQLLKAIQVPLDTQFPGRYRLSGKIHGQHHYIRQMADELRLFVPICLVLLTLFLFISFRNFWAVWVPLVIVLLTVLYLLATLTAMGKSLSILTTILPSILFVVGISDVVHLLEKYIYELRSGHGKYQALEMAYRHIGMATLLTSVTTAVGFATLMNSNIQPIREFGAMAALGVILAFLLAYSLLPAMLVLLPEPRVTGMKRNQKQWNRLLLLLYRFTRKRRRLIGIGTTTLIVACLWAIPNLKVNNYLLEDWDNSDPQKQDYFFFEEQFAGVRPLEFRVHTDTLNLLHPFVANKLAAFEDTLRTVYNAGALTSPNLLIKFWNRGNHGGQRAYYRLPDEGKAYPSERIARKGLQMSGSRRLMSEDLRTGRISGRIKDFGGYDLVGRNERIRDYIQRRLAPWGIQVRQTGMPYLIDKNNRSLSTQMLGGLLLAFLIIGGIMALLFRSWKMVIIAIIPNVIPLLFIAGFMFVAGIDLKVATAIIFTIAFGIAVDDTIHFLSKYRLEQTRYQNPKTALLHTYTGAGKAVAVTTFMLFSGFIALSFSKFASTHYLGLLVSITLLIALVTDLLILPLLIRGFYPRRFGRPRNKKTGAYAPVLQE